MVVAGLEEASGWAAGVTGFFSSAIEILMLIIPVVIIAGLVAGIIFYMRYKKIFIVDCNIRVIANNNLVTMQDKGGVFKNSLGNEEFRLQRSKVCMTIPDREKFWMLNNKGRFTIDFLKIGEADYLPIQTSIGQKIRDILKPDKIKYKEVKGMTPVPTKEKLIEALKDLQYTPIPSQSKSFLQMKTKENIIKFQRQGKFEKLYPIFGIMIVAGLLVFSTMTYFKYAERLTDKGFAGVNDAMNEGQKILVECKRACSSGGYTPTPVENVPPNPLEEGPPV
ncbi:hypothetical protein KKE60_04905 [Patescibacteria group bacterium]|nr:hypothetical protein [Patescibacteria group bacterium]